MKIKVNKAEAPKFKPFDLTLTVESEQERGLLVMALRHFAGRHVRCSDDRSKLLDIATAVDGAK